MTDGVARCSIADEPLDVYDSLTDAVDARLSDNSDTASVPTGSGNPLAPMQVTMDGGVGNDVLSVAQSFATLNGGPGSDQLNGSARTDFLDGGGGGRDVLRGGESPDFLTDGDSSSAPDADLLDGGSNPSVAEQGLDSGDLVSYGSRTRKVSVDLAADVGGQAGEKDQLKNVEDVRGGRASDTLRGDGGTNALYDGEDAGNRPGDKDKLIGRGGDDLLNSTAGRDRLDSGSGDDDLQCAGKRAHHSCRLIGGRGNDDLEGGRGNDRLSGGSGKDKLKGGSGRDKLFSRDRSRDRVNGGPGATVAKSTSATA
ncbi:MAG: calcium-binding protein [Thermoleophilaceae bacterium]